MINVYLASDTPQIQTINIHFGHFYLFRICVYIMISHFLGTPMISKTM